MPTNTYVSIKCTKMLRHMLMIGVLLYQILMAAQESNASINEQGKSVNGLKHSWRSKWVTHPTASTLDANRFLFRKRFDIDTVPEKFVIFISADNRYRLFINGVYVTSGPSSSDLGNYRYETLDIAKYLKPKENMVAVEVVNFGEYRKASTLSFQTALIVQGHDDNVIDINTDLQNGWKIKKDDAFGSIPFVSDSLRGYYAAGPGEHFYSKFYPWNWKEADFDDSGWSEVRAATVEFAVGRGFLYGSTWFLTPRKIPLLREEVQRFHRVARYTLPIKDSSFLQGTIPLVIPPNRHVKMLLDQKKHTIGYPILTYSKGENSNIKITYAEALYDDNWKKGHRDSIKDKHILGYYDLIEPDGGDNRVFQPMGMKTFRYVELEITTKDQALNIMDYHNVYTRYPFDEIASFNTDDEHLSEIWDAAWLTIKNSSTDSYIDPYYEQLQYIGDTRIEALVSLVVAGDDRLMRKALEMFDNSRMPNGLTQSRYPSYIVQLIPTYSLQWINMLHDYHLYRDDDEFLKRFVPGVRTVLSWWIDKIDYTGLPTQMEWWNFTDWADGYENGIPIAADDGYSATIALQLVNALQNASVLFKEFGLDEEAVVYQNIGNAIQREVVKTFFDTDTGMFAENKEKDAFSQHTNILAILTNTVATKDQAILMAKILEKKELIQATLYFKYYLFEALHQSGLGDEYLDLLQNWSNQLSLGLTTFAEKDDEPRSECHGWSASPNYHFLKIVAGIYPAGKNFKEITIQPHFGNLHLIKATMPHPGGLIRIDLQRTATGVEGKVELPEKTNGHFIWEGKKMMLKPGLQHIKI